MATLGVSQKQRVVERAKLGILSPHTVTVNGGELALDTITIAEIPTIHLVGFGAIQQTHKNVGNIVIHCCHKTQNMNYMDSQKWNLVLL